MDKQIYKVNLDIQAERTRFEEERKKLWNELLPMAERINMELVALKNKSYAENVLPFFKHVTELAHKKRRLSVRILRLIIYLKNNVIFRRERKALFQSVRMHWTRRICLMHFESYEGMALLQPKKN